MNESIFCFWNSSLRKFNVSKDKNREKNSIKNWLWRIIDAHASCNSINQVTGLTFFISFNYFRSNVIAIFQQSKKHSIEWIKKHAHIFFTMNSLNSMIFPNHIYNFISWFRNVMCRNFIECDVLDSLWVWQKLKGK